MNHTLLEILDGNIDGTKGKIAKRYEEMGGKCYYFGKPFRDHFITCVESLNLERVAHVGDSLHHDIKGANSAGIDSIFVTGGIHYEELQASDINSLPPKENLDDLFQKVGITPTYVIPMFRL